MAYVLKRVSILRQFSVRNFMKVNRAYKKYWLDAYVQKSFKIRDKVPEEYDLIYTLPDKRWFTFFLHVTRVFLVGNAYALWKTVQKKDDFVSERPDNNSKFWNILGISKFKELWELCKEGKSSEAFAAIKASFDQSTEKFRIRNKEDYVAEFQKEPTPYGEKIAVLIFSTFILIIALLYCKMHVHTIYLDPKTNMYTVIYLSGKRLTFSPESAVYMRKIADPVVKVQRQYFIAYRENFRTESDIHKMISHA